MTRTYRVRAGLVAVGALLALLVSYQPGHSQLRPPGAGIGGGPPGVGIGGGPPGVGIGGGGPGGPAMPGAPGGIAGINGRPPGFPDIPRPPDFPQPPPVGIGGGFGGGIGGGGPNIYQWSCGRCGRVLGSGPVPPATAYCVVCGVNNQIPRPGGGGGINPPITPPGPGMPGGGMPAPALPGAGVPAPAMPPVNVDPPAFDPPPVYVPPSSSSSSSSSSSGSSRVSYGTKVLLITLGVLLLLGVGVTAVVIALVKQKPARKASRRSRPRRRLDDDDY